MRNDTVFTSILTPIYTSEIKPTSLSNQDTITIVNNGVTTVEVQGIDSLTSNFDGIYTEIKGYNDLISKENNKVSTDTIFTVFVTLSVFILGIIIERIIKWIDGCIKRKKLRVLFKLLLINTNTKLVVNLKKAYKTFSEELTVNSGIVTSPPKVISGDFESIVKINSEDLYNAHKNREVLSKMLGQIYFLSKIQIEVDFFHKLVVERSDTLRENIKIKSDDYLGLITTYLKDEEDNNSQYLKSKTYLLLRDSVKKYYTEMSGKRMLTEFYEEIIRVIQVNIIDSKEYKKSEKLAEILELGRQLSHTYNELKHSTDEIKGEYLKFSEYLKDSNKIIEDEIRYLS